MFAFLKHDLKENIISSGFWLERSTPIPDVMGLIHELSPCANGRGLARFGPSGDGGYLMPDDLEGIVASISPGVSAEAGFDVAVADRGIDVYLADASVEAPPLNHPRFHFTPKFLDVYDSENTVTLDRYCAEIAPVGDMILQMDIEGAEYRVLTSMSEALQRRFRIMVVEFHDLGSLHCPFAFRDTSRLFRKLLRTHAVVHLHPNNYQVVVRGGGLEIPPLMEMTFYRRDRDVFEKRELRFPHSLDEDNVAGPSLVLPKCWH